MALANITTFDFQDLNQFQTIYCMISGGIDSTYLWEMCKQELLHRDYDAPSVYIVNCYNPYEQSETLTQLSQLPNFIQIQPPKSIDYTQVLRDAFLRIPKARTLLRHRKYEKKVFKCCHLIKLDSYKNSPLFLDSGSVVISGIKAGDGKQRAYFLKDLRNEHTFYHRHKEGQLFCYPFRDYRKRELPQRVIKELRQTYPSLNHSGCALCPVLVVFKIKSEGKRYYNSLRYYNQLMHQQKLQCRESEKEGR